MKSMLICFVAFSAIIATISAQEKCGAKEVEMFCEPEDDEAAIKKFSAECQPKVRASWVTIKPKHKEACDGKADIEKTCTTMYKMYSEFIAIVGADCMPKK